MIDRHASADIFSTFVRASADGEALDDRLAERVWERLRSILMFEIRRRGLWNTPPAYLGVIGFSHWSNESIDELVFDCFAYVFIDRLRSLIAQAGVKPSVVGLVVRCVRNFLYDRQRKNDPLGFRVFSALRSSVRKAVDRGEMFILEGDSEIRSDTVLGFSTRTAVAESSEEEVAEVVRTWSDDLLPDLITANGRQWKALNERLLDHLASLRTAGIESFRFRQLVNPLKGDVRARWAALWSQEEDDIAFESGTEAGSLVRFVRPDRTFEERDRYEKLVVCVSSHLERAEVSERDRHYVQILWGFLCTYAADHIDQGDPLSTSRSLVRGPPSYRHLATFLNIPRARIGGLFKTLGNFVQRCDQAFSGAVGDSGDVSSSQDG